MQILDFSSPASRVNRFFEEYRRFTRLFFLCVLLGAVIAVVPVPAQTQPQTQSQSQDETDALITNGSSSELAEIRQMAARLTDFWNSKESNPAAFLEIPDWQTGFQIRTRLTHAALSPTGALVRQKFLVTDSRRKENSPGAIAEGFHEFWLARHSDGSFRFTDKHWLAPNDAIAVLQEAAREEWKRASASQSTTLLHLVVMRRGGRWIALRRSNWSGAILDTRNLEQLQRTQNISQGEVFDSNWLQAQMKRAPADEAGTGHFVLQKGAYGWIGIGMAWETESHSNPQADQKAAVARQRILAEAYPQPTAHRTLGILLAQVGLFQEAADSLEKAQLLNPELVDARLLAEVQKSKPNDPENEAITQLEDEARVGLDPNHPAKVVDVLATSYQSQPSVLSALRLGLEYSRLGDDARASQWLRASKQLAARGALRDLPTSDRQWIRVLSEHLEERQKLAAMKPTHIIRSSLFTLHCRLNDLSSVQVLAALETAQHTVYANFGIPMGSTEVLLWPSQREFQQYVTQFSQQGHSEFVAALTLTKLIATRQGPMVLGEEINLFINSRPALFSTIAHEYGHVAVRQLSRGRDVPTWFNEGIATSAEGGYDGYLERVRRAAKTQSLLPMSELLRWDVDGERAFLAYSQANSILDYIIDTWGKSAVLNILRRIGNDEPAESAFISALGISQQELWNRWAAEGVK